MEKQWVLVITYNFGKIGNMNKMGTSKGGSLELCHLVSLHVSEKKGVKGCQV